MNIMDYSAWVAVSEYFFFSNMVLERAICVVILCFFALGSATICSHNRDCDRWSGESCCSDSVCRKTCIYCYVDSDCGTGEVCCDGGDCLSFCPSSWTGASIAGAVVGTIVFFAIVISIVACFCCACCPYYRYRSPGTVIVSQPAPYQPIVSTTHTTMSAQQVQHYPPPGPPPANYNQPPPPGYNQAPPPYPSYPQQPGQYPPPPVQGQPPVPPPVSAGGPVKY